MSKIWKWRPVDSGETLVTSAKFEQAMEHAFGRPPWVLETPEHVDVLSAMAAICQDDPNPYLVLVHAIGDDFRSITVEEIK